MNILYVHRTQAGGVEGVHIGEIVKAMRHRGHTVHIVSPVGEQLGDVAGGATTAGWRQRCYRFVTRSMPELVFELLELVYNLKAARDIRRRFMATDVDAIFERYAIFGLAGARIARQWRKPFYLEINYTAQSPLVRRRARLLKPLARMLDRRLFRQADGLFAVSTYLKDHLIRDYGVAPDRIAVLPNAADPVVFDPAKIRPAAASAGGRLIGFVGGFYPWHGLPLLVQAFARLAPEFPEARLLLIGDGPMRPEIEQAVRAAALDGRVMLPGQLPHAELPGWLAGFHVGVMPDSNVYGSPMKIFEYMAMGKPVVVPDYGPLRDAVTDGQEGFIFRPGDVDHLAACLARLLRDDELYQRMARQARRRIEERHNWVCNADTILKTMANEVSR